jgi:hypothetical protein
LREAQRDLLGGLAAVALGLAAFIVLIGYETLIPTNIGWLSFADRGMHTLGWMFFREAPWGVPPGLSPDLGIELSGSIALVDGLPLFALPFKLVSAWLPHPFQYWGDWLLLSFVLHALFAWLIARQLGAGRLLSLIAAAFALITPALMFRIEMHLALSGHWTVLAALYLCVRREPPRRWAWPLLVTVTALVHAYLLALVMALWIAALAERLWTGRMRRNAALVELVAGAIATGVALWAAGFFVTPSIGTYGYGDYKLNLLWPFLTYRGWSHLVPDLPHTEYDYEGLSFLGIGIFLLLALAVLSGGLRLLRPVVSRRWLPLAVMLVLLMVFAITAKVSFAGVTLFTIPLPHWMVDLFSTFRSTGRFVWPLLYLVTIGIVVMLGRQLKTAVAVPLALAAFAAQAVDSAPALLNFHTHLGPITDRWETPFVSPFWERAVAAGYNRIRVIPVQMPGTDWRPLGYFAVTHHMQIDSVYLGRVDDDALAALRAHDGMVLATGDFEPKTLYILDAGSAAVAAQTLRPGDLLATIDDHVVFARGGARLVDGLGIAPRLEPARGSG